MGFMMRRTASQRLGSSFKRTSEACKALHERGLISLEGDSKRNRIYRSPEVLEAYMAIEALR